MEGKIAREEGVEGEIEKRMRAMQGEEQSIEMIESRYCRRYEEIWVSWVPAYLRNGVAMRQR